MSAPLLRVVRLKKVFPPRRHLFARRGHGDVRAVDGVDLEIDEAETLGLVGESGSGKTTLAYCILRLLEPTAGSVLFSGIDVLRLDIQLLRKLRREMQIVFQDALGALDPRMTVSEIIREPLDVQRIGSRPERQELVRTLLQRVAMAPEVFSDRRPLQLSAGQRQRVALARALALSPRFLILDEPVASLDAGARRHILDLLSTIRQEGRLSCLLVTHDLGVVRAFAHRIAVMYLGRIVELAATDRLIESPLHPYTRGLVGSHRRTISWLEDDQSPGPEPVRGDPPSPFDVPSGCRFRGRCPMTIADCAQIDPPLRQVAPGHFVACIRV